MTNNLPSALAYARRRGWPVFPCEVGGKKPHGRLAPHGLRNATTDETQIVSWWTAEPAANIGVPTGTVSGFFTVDIDTKNNGPATWASLTADRATLRTASSRTPTGGEHLHFRMPQGATIRNSAGKLGPGVDVRGTGGYIVAPGSTRPEGAYTWGESSTVMDAPQWLLEMVVEKPAVSARTKATAVAAIPAGTRNQTLASLAGTMRRRGMAPEAIVAGLQAENATKCDPPLSEGEVTAIAQSVSKYEAGAALVPERRGIQLTPASSIRIRPVRWLWQDRLPLGALALVGGREGIGKTICVYTIAADITQGRLGGVYKGTPKAVIVAATEDSWEHTIVPRLMAAGADLDRVYRVDVVTSLGTNAPLSLPKDITELGKVIGDADAALIILDPLLSRLDASLDTHKDAEVRLALEPLSALADEANVSVVGLIHVNKSTSTDVLTTLMASRAFAAVARSVLFVMQDPDDEKVRLLGQGKNNLGQMDLPTLAFRIVGEKVADTVEGPIWTGKLEWLGEADRTLREAVEAAAVTTGDRTAMSEAADWLSDFLVSKGGSADSATAKREGAKAGHSVDALKRARKRLRVTAEGRGFPRQTFWLMPAQLEEASRSKPGETALTAPTALTGLQLAQSAQLEQLAETPRTSAPTGNLLGFPPAGRLN